MRLLEKTRNGVYLVAEMSANHTGKLENAIEIVHAAKSAGADCLKIQTYTADSMTIDCDNAHFQIQSGLWNGYKLYDLYKDAATPYEWQRTIKDTCDEIGMDFLSTPFDKSSVDFLEELGVEAYKVASFELVDIPLIKYVASKGKPVILSCGMGSYEEIEDAVNAMIGEGLPKNKIFPLKCTSEYPAEISDMNLATIADMREKFGVTVGLSDHTIGTLAPLVAVSLGARIVEKHFCLSRKMKNPDSSFSSEPAEFAEMANVVREAVSAKGSVEYGATGNEKDSVVFRRSIFAVRDIKKGEAFTAENIRVIRPGYGAKPKYYDALIGKESERAYARGTPVEEGLNG